MADIKKINQPMVLLKQRKKVAAYARVSMETEMLHHSLSAQISYYSDLIQKNPEWVYAGVYADEGITGTSINKREEFKRMLEDCRAGKIDLILVKSISRFARDTVDCLNTVRELKKIGIAVYFEREKINSLSSDGEVMLTLLASFAQAEAESISRNQRWAIQKKFEKGIPHSATRCFGYDWDPDTKKYIINPDEAEWVRYIYREFLKGASLHGLEKDLREKGVIGSKGIPIERTGIKGILTSETYIGDRRLQKTFSTGPHKSQKNRGQKPQYYVEGAHEAIISREEFEAVQSLFKKKKKEHPHQYKHRHHIFAKMVKCGKCGYACSHFDPNKNLQTNIPALISCTQRMKKKCDLRPIREEELLRIQKELFGEEEIQQIILDDEQIEFISKNGKRKIHHRSIYDGGRRQYCYTKKVRCGCCNDKFSKEARLWTCQGRRYHRTDCDNPPITWKELDEATAWATESPDDFEIRFYCDVDHALIYDDKIEYYFKDGRVKEWQRQFK